MKRLFYNLILSKYKKQGLQIGSTSTVIGLPRFGSEPFLVSIGEKVTISSNVTFITHDGGTRLIRNNPKYKNTIKFGRITIHDNCFVGHSALIMPGVTIGPNSIVAAGSIVTKSVPPNCIYGGNPAKHIMTLEEYAEKVLQGSPDYDPKNWKENKKAELLKLFPYPW